MNENSAATFPSKPVIYQVIATRHGDNQEHVLRARLGSKPFLIGSGKLASLLLDTDAILPVQIRLLTSTTGQILLTNLGEDGQVIMGGEPVSAHVPTYWKPGVPVTVADFELQLVTLVEEENEVHLERVKPSLITQASEAASDSNGVDFVIDWGDGGDEQLEPEDADISTVLFDKEALDVPTDQAVMGNVGEGWRLETPSEVPVSESLPVPPELPAIDEAELPVVPPEIPRFDESASLPTEAIPTEVSLAVGAELASENILGGHETLPKNWQVAGKLSAQLPTESVNLVAGERVRIPISVRNESANPMYPRIHVAGLPSDWSVSLENVAQLLPGEVKSIDVVLETKAPFHQAYLDILLRVHDQLFPEHYLTLSLRLNFKNAPNIVGQLTPTRVTSSRVAYLNLHNHTQVPITTFIAGHSQSSDIHIVPAQAQLDLPPGQTTEIPVNIHLSQRPWLLAKQHDFSVSVRHSNRAALDYPAVVRVTPRIPLWLVLLIVSLLTLLAVIWNSRGNGASTAADVTADSPAQLPVIVEQTETVTSEAESTNEVRVAPSALPDIVTSRPRASFTPRPTATRSATNTPPPTVMLAVTDILPTPTMAPLELAPEGVSVDDPRPPECTSELPDGWSPYIVQPGDRVFRLAVTHGTTLEEIVRVNCLADPRLLQVGQVLLLPAP